MNAFGLDPPKQLEKHLRLNIICGMVNVSPESLAEVLEKPSEERLASDVLTVATWFKDRVKALRDVTLDILEKLVQGCITDTRVANELIIREGDIGDRMFILLKGSATIHQVGDLDENETLRTDAISGSSRCIVQDPSIFGPCVGRLESGAIFGEVALIEDCRRTATVIACGPSRTDGETHDLDTPRSPDVTGKLRAKKQSIAFEPCVQMVVISRDLYNHTVRTAIEKQFAIRMNFVNQVPYFRNRTVQQKNQLALSLDIYTFPYDTMVVRQKDKFKGLYYIIE